MEENMNKQETREEEMLYKTLLPEPEDKYFNPLNIYCHSFDEAVERFKSDKRNKNLSIEITVEETGSCVIKDEQNEVVGEAVWERNYIPYTGHKGTFRIHIQWLV